MTQSSITLKGSGVSPGIVVGEAVVVLWGLPNVPHRLLRVDEVDSELERLDRAIGGVKERLKELRRRTEVRAGPEEAKIFDTHVMMLEDEEFIDGVRQLIRENRLTAERAFEFKTLELRALWNQSGNVRLRERINDLWAVQVRVLQYLLGAPAGDQLERERRGPAVVFTRELTPGLTVEFDRDRVAAFVSEEGTRTSHAAILARSLGIPCIVGASCCVDEVTDGATVIVDATRGTVIVNPTAEEIEDAHQRAQVWRELEQEVRLALGKPAVTTDGTEIELRGNLDLPEELNAAVESGANGVGLLRTEFLMVGRPELPGEEEQFAYYKRVVERFPEAPVIIRSYDLGGDKFPAAFRLPRDPNPFLGWRAIRVCLDHPAIFITQIRALLRARQYGDVKLMLPLVTELDEIRQTRELVRAAARDLEEEGVGAADDLPVGVMIETPSAALLADRMAAESDFLSVGTNDLTQYILAVDRSNARLADRFVPFHPAVLRSLQHIADVARSSGIEISVCGEMASDPFGAFLLIGMGYEVLSIAPSHLALIRWLIRMVEIGGARRAVEECLKEGSVAEVEAVLAENLYRYLDPRLLDESRLPTATVSTTLKS